MSIHPLRAWMRTCTDCACSWSPAASHRCSWARSEQLNSSEHPCNWRIWSKHICNNLIWLHLVRMFRFISVHGVECFMHSYACITSIICQSLSKRASGREGLVCFVYLYCRGGLSKVRRGPILFPEPPEECHFRRKVRKITSAVNTHMYTSTPFFHSIVYFVFGKGYMLNGSFLVLAFPTLVNHGLVTT